MASNTSSPADAIRAKNAKFLSDIQIAVTGQSDTSQNVTYLLTEIRNALQAQEGAELQALNIRTAQAGDSTTSALTATFNQATTARNLQIAELGNVYANISAYSNAPNADVVKLGDLAGTGPSSIEGLTNAVDGAAAALLVHERTLIVVQRERAHRLRDARDESDIDLAQGRQIIKRFAQNGTMSDQDAKIIAAELQAQVVNTTRQLDVITALIPTPATPSMFDRVSNEPENGDNNNIRRRMADRLEDVKEELRVAILALQDAIFSNLPVNAAANSDLAKQLFDAQNSIKVLQDTIDLMQGKIDSLGSEGTGGSDPDCQENLKQARTKIDTLHQMCLRLRRERDNALQQIKTRQRGITQLKKDLKKVQKKVDKGDTVSAKKDLDDCNEQVKRLEVELAEAKKNKNNSPDMQAEIDSLKLTNAEYEKEVEKLRDLVRSLQNQIAKIGKDGFNMDDCEKMLHGIRIELAEEAKKSGELSILRDNLQTMLNTTREDIVKLQQEIDALKEQLKANPHEGSSNCEERVKGLQKLLEAHKSQLDKNSETINALNAEKKTLQDTQEDTAALIKDLERNVGTNSQEPLKNCQDQLKSLREQISQLRTAATRQITLIETLQSTNNQNVSDLAARMKTINEMKIADEASEKERTQLEEVIDALKKEAETVVGSPDQILKLQQEKQRLEERLADCQRLGEVDKNRIAKLVKNLEELEKIIEDGQSSDENEDCAKLKEELKGLRQGAEDGQNYIEHLDEVIAERDDRITLLNERVDRRNASIEQLNTAIDAYKEAEDSSTANEANVASLEVQVEQLQEANEAIEVEVESLLGDHEGNHPLTLAIKSRNTSFIEGTKRIARTKKIRDDLKAKLAACNEKKKPKPGHVGQQSAGGKPSGKHLDPALKQVRAWQRGRWFGYKPTPAMIAQDVAAAVKKPKKPKKVAQNSPQPAKKLAKTTTAKRRAEDDKAPKTPAKKAKVEKKRPAENDEKPTKKPAKKAKVEKKSPTKKQVKQ